MTTVSIQIPHSALLEAVEKLDHTTFNEFVDEVLLLKARRAAPNMTSNAANLLEQINALGLSAVESNRLHFLMSKAEEGTLTPIENGEQQQLSDKSERANAQRMVLVGQLANLWGKPLEAVLQQLGLWNSHNHA